MPIIISAYTWECGIEKNSMKPAGGRANLEMLTRRYGSHSYESVRERLNQKMDDFLERKAGQEPQPIDTEQDEKRQLLSKSPLTSYYQ